MKIHFLFLLLPLFVLSCSSPTEESTTDKKEPKAVIFPDASFTSAVAYHFEDLQGNPIIDKKGKLNPSVKKEKQLDQTEIDFLLQTLNNNDTYGGAYTRCFKPRLGIVFYDKMEPVAHVSICFECSQQHAQPMIKAYSEAPIGQHGYSELGLRKLTSFCHKLGFGQCSE